MQSNRDAATGLTRHGSPAQGQVERPTSRLGTERNLAELLRSWYSDPKKKPPRTLTRATIRALAEAPRPDRAELDALADLAQSDRTLEKTRYLLLLAVRIHRARVSGDLRGFAGHVLERHPAFRTRTLAALFTAGPDGPGDAEAVELLGAQDYAAFSWPESVERLSRMELRRCRENAISCALIWLSVTGRVSLECVVAHLRQHVWASDVRRRDEGEATRLHALVGTRDGSAAAIVGMLLEAQVREERELSAASRIAEKRAVVRAADLAQELERAQATLKEVQAAKRAVEEALEQERRARADERACLKDDYQRLRGTVLRRLRADVSLLDDGLHALQRDPPKVRVMRDHAERVIDSLRTEAKRLAR